MSPLERPRTYVLHVSVGSSADGNSRLEEARGLAEAICLDVVGAYHVSISSPRPSTFIGKGWVERLQRELKDHEVGLLYVDAALSPVQQRNLEKVLSCKVIDRTGLILEIFGARAKTSEGRLQVRLAALNYQKSRLVKSWTHLERQKGGFGFMGGPGESQLELDKRMLGDQIASIQKDLDAVKKTRTVQRQARQRLSIPTIALVGYTNAGKSTLFNRLTQSQVFADDLLFATLDPTVRQIKLPQGDQVVISDTVGFISDLPTLLVAAFRATLEEVAQADLLLHVRDITHPETDRQAEDVYTVLKAMGLEDKIQTSLFEVWNKIDLLPPEEQEERKLQAHNGSLPTFLVSALSGEGCSPLLRGLGDFCARNRRVYHFAVPPEDGKAIAWLYAHGFVQSRYDTETESRLSVVLGEREADLFLVTFAECHF